MEVPLDVIEKFAREHGHPAVLQSATVTQGEVAPHNEAALRRIVS